MDKTSDTRLKNICLKSDFEGIVVHLIEGFIESKQTKKKHSFPKENNAICNFGAFLLLFEDQAFDPKHRWIVVSKIYVSILYQTFYLYRDCLLCNCLGLS